MPTVQDYYNLPAQYSLEDWTTSTPEGDVQAVSYAPGYALDLLALRQKVLSGQATDWEREDYAKQAQAAMAVPLRDVSMLTYDAGEQGPGTLSGGSPDLGRLMLTLQDKIDQGTASPQERALFQTTYANLADQNWRASVPQPSDAFSPLGDNLFSALGILGLGATGGLAAAPLFAGGAGLATTLGSLGTLSGIAGTGAGVLGGATGQDWLSKIGLGLGAAGGILGGLGGLSSLWGTGVQSLSDAAKLASGVGKITGAVGSASGNDALRQASRYLGQAGQLGQFGAGVLPSSFTDWSGGNSPLAANVAPGVSNLLSAADVATQRGGGGMEMDWLDFETGPGGYGFGGDVGAYSSPDYFQSPAYQAFTGWGGDETQTGWYQGADLDTSSGGGGFLGGLGSVLGGIGGFLGKNAGLLGPLASTLGSLGGGAIGSNAANEAARLQAAALNRGINLSEAQWLQQLARTQPWVQAGQQALGTLQGLAGQQLPGLPGTQPFQYSGPEMPGQGFQYTGAGMPSTGFQYSGPGMPATGFQYSGPGMPTQDFKAPTWDELKARDPGIQARLAEAQKAIETSAAARGMTMSGSTLGALQRQSQTLAANEYAPAYQRALGEYQQEFGQDWQRQQEAYQRQRAENELLYGRGYQQQGDIYGRQLAENQLGYNRQWQQQMTDYERQLAQNQLGYGRGMEQYKIGYGQQAAMNEQAYARQQALYKQQLAQHLLPWEQNSTLAQLGAQVTGQLGNQGIASSSGISNLLGQLGTAQGMAPMGSALSWQKALGGATNQLPSILAGLNA